MDFVVPVWSPRSQYALAYRAGFRVGQKSSGWWLLRMEEGREGHESFEGAGNF